MNRSTAQKAKAVLRGKVLRTVNKGTPVAESHAAVGSAADGDGTGTAAAGGGRRVLWILMDVV